MLKPNNFLTHPGLWTANSPPSQSHMASTKLYKGISWAWWLDPGSSREKSPPTATAAYLHEGSGMQIIQHPWTELVNGHNSLDLQRVSVALFYPAPLQIFRSKRFLRVIAPHRPSRMVVWSWWWTKRSSIPSTIVRYWAILDPWKRNPGNIREPSGSPRKDQAVFCAGDPI